MADPHDATAHTLTTHTHTHAATTGQGVNDHHVEDHDHDGTPTQKLLAANSHESPSADTHHAKNHTNAEHPWFVIIRKTADETLSLTTTSQDDDHLFFSIAANEIWAFEMFIIYNSGTVGDFKYQVDVPAGATGYVVRVDASNTTLAFGTDSPSIAGVAGGLNILLPITGVVVNSSTAGTVQFQWAPFATDAVNTVVTANSYLVARRMA